jgi:hypothetical protein
MKLKLLVVLVTLLSVFIFVQLNEINDLKASVEVLEDKNSYNLSEYNKLRNDFEETHAIKTELEHTINKYQEDEIIQLYLKCSSTINCAVESIEKDENSKTTLITISQNKNLYLLVVTETLKVNSYPIDGHSILSIEGKYLVINSGTFISRRLEVVDLTTGTRQFDGGFHFSYLVNGDKLYYSKENKQVKIQADEKKLSEPWITMDIVEFDLENHTEKVIVEASPYHYFWVTGLNLGELSYIKHDVEEKTEEELFIILD